MESPLQEANDSIMNTLKRGNAIRRMWLEDRKELISTIEETIEKIDTAMVLLERTASSEGTTKRQFHILKNAYDSYSDMRDNMRDILDGEKAVLDMDKELLNGVYNIDGIEDFEDG